MDGQEQSIGRWQTLYGFGRYVFRRFWGDGAPGVAASLAYTSLLSLVPLIAIGLAIMAVFPAFDEVRDTLVKQAANLFFPALGGNLQNQLTRFVANVERLTTVGLVGLGVTALMQLTLIERAFNTIFRVSRHRPLLSRLLAYWTMLTLGPLLMGAAFSLQGYVVAVGRAHLGSNMGFYLSYPVPTLLTVLAFVVLFALIPNRTVKLRDALVGAVVAAVLFAVLRWGFGWWLSNTKAYVTIYGAVATLPLFLIWVYLSWGVTMVGAEITAALPEWRMGRRDIVTGGYHPVHRLTLALQVLEILRSNSEKGGRRPSHADLLSATAATDRELQALECTLEAAGLITLTAWRRYVLSRDLRSVQLGQLLDILGLNPQADAAVWPGRRPPAWHGALLDRLRAADVAQKETLEISVEDLLLTPVP